MTHTLLIGIVSHDRAAATECCVRAVLKEAAVSTRLVVADNGSRSAKTRSLLNQLEAEGVAEIVRMPENLGPSGGKNAILERAEGEPFVALLDNDTQVLSGWDLAALRAMERGAHLVQPKLLERDLKHVDRGPNRPSSDPLAANPKFLGRGEGRYSPCVSAPREVAIVGCGVTTAGVFEKIGHFDEELWVGEDYDFSQRAADAGFRLVYEPECEMIHDHGLDLGYDNVRANPKALLNSFARYWRKHGRSLLCPRYFGWYSWLDCMEEPMYLAPFSSEHLIFRRIRRRLARAWFMGIYPGQWSGRASVERSLKRRDQALRKRCS